MDKAMLRSEMRKRRRSLPGRAERSRRIWEALVELPQFIDASTVMAYWSVPGEPETHQAITEWRRAGRVVVLPEDAPPVDPSSVDLVIVPGVAFTSEGDRLGQGGGWYDRFLAEVESPTVGVCFDAQILDAVPTEPHDVRVDLVITEKRRLAHPPDGG